MSTSPARSTSIAPSTNWVARLRGILLVSVLTGIVLLLYLLGILSKDWLNRIGLLINAFIGLLFAPAILDSTGFFGRAVPRLETFTHRLYTWTLAQLPGVTILLERLAGKPGRRIGAVLVSTLMSIGIISGFVTSGWIFVLGLLTVLGPLGSIVTVGDAIHHLITKKRFSVPRTVLVWFLFPFLFPFFIIATPVFFVANHVLLAMSTIAGSLHGSLKEQERLRSSIIGWGIVIFVIGNVFQFLASF